MDQNSRTNIKNISTKPPKVAIFCDWLNQWGGAESVLLNLIKIYPQAPIFTLVYNPSKTGWLPKTIKIIPSVLNKLPLSKYNPIFYTPIYSTALEQFDFSDYDIVISSTFVSGYVLITPPHTLFVCYYHNVNRYVYQTPPQFSSLKWLLNKYQKIDYLYSKRPDYLLCNSKTVQNRIKNTYHRKAQIIYPGFDTKCFHPSNHNHNDYFLVVSRLVQHKKIDIAIKACHILNLKLKIIGEGRNKKTLINLKNKLNAKNIEFLGYVNQNELVKYYQNCTALICTQEEDFGLTPLEAQACGKPVIAYNKGGITETVVNKVTGIFFNKQTPKSLIQVLKNFRPKDYNPTNCVINASRFSQQNFMLNFTETINRLWQKHQKNQVTTL